MTVRPSTSKYLTRWKFSSTEDVVRFIALVKQHPTLQERIPYERLLPEWEKLVPVTGISATEMAGKWKRLCDKYRAELRREMQTGKGNYKSNWAHFHQMAFVRSIEEKRMRMNEGMHGNIVIPETSTKLELGTTSRDHRRNITHPNCIKLEPGTTSRDHQQTINELKFIKLEPGMPSSDWVVSSSSRTKTVGTFRKPESVSNVQSQVPSLSSPGPSTSLRSAKTAGTFSKPATLPNCQSQEQTKNCIPIERVLVTEKVKVGLAKESIREDLQFQAGRVVASGTVRVPDMPVPRIPIPHLPVSSIRDAPDNDFDFLMIRIYPLLSAMPLSAKQLCYEMMQSCIVDMFEKVSKARREMPRAGNRMLHRA